MERGALYDALNRQLQDSLPEPLADTRATFLIALRDDGEVQELLLRGGRAPSVVRALPGTTASCKASLSAADFHSLLEGGCSIQQLFFSGRLQLEGDLLQAVALNALSGFLKG